ncbi:MAG: hypothetical protein F6K30_27520 [Cyanothece sp. SIO2G6]|nr:hypothetical protein [Cyanothece sp. SIO2G6]
MVFHTSSTTRDLPLVEAAQMGNLEAIASLLQQTITVSQPDFLPTDVVQTVMQTMTQTAASVGRPASHVVTNDYDSRWTDRGILVNAVHPVSAPLTWQLRPTPDPSYRCAPLTRLLGRQDLVNGAIASLQSGGITAITGINGIGKTAILRTLCHHPQLTAQFAQRILYMRGCDRPLEDIWQSIVDGLYQANLANGANGAAIEIKPSTPEMQTLLAQASVCIVLDELTGDRNQCADLMRWSQMVTQTPLLVALSIEGSALGESFKGQQCPMQGLPIQDAIVLLEEGLGRSLQAHEWQDAQYLCQQLVGYPRRLIQSAALVRQQQHSLADLVQHLRRGTTVDAMLLKTVGALPDPERRIVAILATLGGIPLHPNHLPTLMNLSRDTASVDEPLQTLIQHGIVIVDGPYCRLADNLVPPIQRSWNLEPWATQIISYFTAWLTQSTTASLAMAESILPIQANSDTLWGVLRLAVRQQQWSAVLAIGTAMQPGLWLGKQWGRWQQVLLLQWLAARSLQDKTAEATVLHQLGSRALCLGDRIAAQTYLTQAFHYRCQLGVPPAVLRVLQSRDR